LVENKNSQSQLFDPLPSSKTRNDKTWTWWKIWRSWANLHVYIVKILV